MKKLNLILPAWVLYSSLWGQDSIPKVVFNPYFAHYYPSALIAGDISFGFEHVYKKRMAHEFSFNVKIFEPGMYYYDKGCRFDYLVKYNIYTGRRFHISPIISFEYKYIYSLNKTVNYHYTEFAYNSHPKIYQILLEDMKWVEYGTGAGLSVNFKIYKQFFLGGDIAVNVVRYKMTYDYKEIIYRDTYSYNPFAIAVPSTSVQERLTWSPLLRFKLSCLLGC